MIEKYQYINLKKNIKWKIYIYMYIIDKHHNSSFGAPPFVYLTYFLYLTQ